MGNIVDYIRLWGGKGFAEKPFCPVDAAVLCQLSYLKFEHTGAKTLLETMSDAGRNRLFDDSRFGDRQRQLYFEAAFSARYQNMRISHVRSVKNEDEEVCFCAVIFEPEGALPAVVFRGTDEYVVGWKEDFEMAYRCPVPAQSLSVDYLQEETAKMNEFYVCGHSKGGNLAEYSAVCCGDEFGGRIKTVYNLDGPGFAPSAKLPSLSKLDGRLIKLVPKLSFVGQLLRSTDNCVRVDSEGQAILQHDIFNWNVDEKSGDFVYLDSDNDALRFFTGHLNSNVEKLSPEQLERFVESLFGILDEADITNLADFGKHWLKNSRKILSAYIDLDDDTRDVLSDTISALIF